MGIKAGHWILVTGASGGAGASTVAAVLAATAAKNNQPVCLIDGHFGGGGLEVTLGAEQAAGLRWPDFALAQGRIDMRSVLPALLQWQGVSVLTAQRGTPKPPSPAAVAAILGSFDQGVTVILDAPASWSHNLMLPAGTVGSAVIVAGRNLGSVAGALAAQKAIEGTGLGPGLVVTSHQHCALTPAEVARSCGLKLWGDIRPDRKLAHATELGAGPLGVRSRARSDLLRMAQKLPGTTW